MLRQGRSNVLAPGATDTVARCLKEKSIFHQPGLNEELGATAVWGSQQGEF